MHLADLSTPTLILDRRIMEANIDKMARRCRDLGVSLRPHVKTPKSIPIAKALQAAGAAGFTVSTLNEAEFLAAAGFDDIFYAVPLEGNKVRRVARLLRTGVKLSLLVDSLEAARHCALSARSEGVVLPLWVEIDVDHYRTGIAAASAEFIELMTFISETPATVIRGLMSYAGASYACHGPTEVADLTERHRLALLQATIVVRSLGLPRPNLSFGSTPAVLHARQLQDIDEVRCGIYTFQDLYQAGIGTCGREDIALSVLATVIGRNRELNRITIDAGGLALSKDRSTQGRPFDAGYGLVCHVESGLPIGDLQVSAVSQELGMVTSLSKSPIRWEELPIGARVRVLPNHADMTAAAYDEYHVVDGSDQVNDVWARTNRWSEYRDGPILSPAEG